MKIIWQRYSIGWWWHVQLTDTGTPIMAIERGMLTSKIALMSSTVGVWSPEMQIPQEMSATTLRRRTQHHIDILASRAARNARQLEWVLTPPQPPMYRILTYARRWLIPFTKQDVVRLRDAVRRECGPEVAARIHM